MIRKKLKLVVFTLFNLLTCAYVITGCNLSDSPTLDPGKEVGGTRGSLHMRLRINRSDCIRPSEQVKIQLTITNNGEEPIRIETQGKPTVDIIVAEPSSHEILLSWAEQNPGLTTTELNLPPKQMNRYEIDWTAPAFRYPPGYHMAITALINEGTTERQYANINVCMTAPYE